MSNKPGFTHAGHMRRALRLAKKGSGWTAPNPMVGAVLVKDGERIGEGYHKRYGGDHAEVEALKEGGSNVKDSILYVTLEPCCHTGKTPPCTDAIIKSSVRKVVIAAKDPSEKVSGKGIEILRKNGIEVQTGILEDTVKELNKAFFVFHEKKRPYITIKIALSYDGKIAKERGKTTKLTGKRANKWTHRIRHENQAILVGAGTVLADNPNLGVREVEGSDPLRIVLKGNRELPNDLEVFRDDNYLVLEKMKVPEIVDELYEKEIISVLIEGGQEVIDSFLEAKIVDEIYLFYAPFILGPDALSFTQLKGGLSFSNPSVQQLGQDVLIRAKTEWDSNNG